MVRAEATGSRRAEKEASLPRPRACPVPAESGHALDSFIGACPFRRTGVHFAGTCASVLYALAHALVGEPVSTSPGHALTAGEIRNAPLGHGFHALLEIVGLAQPALLGELVLGRLGDAFGKPGAQRRPRREHAERRVLRDLGG